MNIISIPSNLVFSPCKVDGAYWEQFHSLISYLGNPEELVRIKNEDPDQYYLIIEPLIRFVSVTEQELNDKGLLKEVSLTEDNN